FGLHCRLNLMAVMLCVVMQTGLANLSGLSKFVRNGGGIHVCISLKLDMPSHAERGRRVQDSGARGFKPFDGAWVVLRLECRGFGCCDVEMDYAVEIEKVQRAIRRKMREG
ncbi:MAG: hypothetical protein ACRERV_11350, partial [Methylococcales bacterium]